MTEQPKEIVGKSIELIVKPSLEELEQLDGETTICDFKRKQLEREARKNWDRFYRRNGDNFFKDRNWTRRELEELCGEDVDLQAPLTIIEAGCGCGNTIFPMVASFPNWRFSGLDFSQNAIALLQKRASRLGVRVQTEVLDMTAVPGSGPSSALPSELPKADLISLIFVLSSISPEHYPSVVTNLRNMLKPSGNVIFRDYGAFDHAMLRFSKSSKISERFYYRQDGTRAFYFYAEEVSDLFEKCGFETFKCGYVYRKTKNVKEQIYVDRVFIEGRFKIKA